MYSSKKTQMRKAMQIEIKLFITLLQCGDLVSNAFEWCFFSTTDVIKMHIILRGDRKIK